MTKTNIFFFVFIIIFVSLKTHAVATRDDDDKLAELSSKEEELVKWASYGEEKLSTVVITGKLLCHVAPADHKLSSHPYPVSGSSIAVFFMQFPTWKKYVLLKCFIFQRVLLADMVLLENIKG